ncbi:MAG: hypothetical protein LJE68_09730 [Rhodobacter sp.]|nr:hypothetical protein [Rhodobacter sp.]
MTTTPTFWSDEFLVNTNTTAYQDQAKVAALPDGGFVIVWRENDVTQDPSGDSSIKIQRFDATGAKVGGEIFRTGASPQSDPDIVAREDGGFVIMYRTEFPGNPNAMFASFGPDNSAQTSFASTGGVLGQQAVARLVNGNIVAVWHSNADNIGVYSRDPQGTSTGGNLFTANAGTADTVNEPAIAALANGGYVIAWDDDTNGQLEFRVFSSTDDPVTGDVIAATAGTASIQQPALAGLANGNFILTWTSSNPAGFDSGTYGVYGQIFTPYGSAASGEFLINTTTPGGQSGSEVTPLDDGGFMVVWQDASQTGGDTSSNAIRGQRYDENFNRVGSEFLINETTSSSQSIPDVAVLGDGRIVVVWQDTSGVFDPSGAGVVARILDPRDSIINGDNGDDFIHGRIGDTTINGFDGNDSLIGMDGDDAISGGAGNDTIFGGGGEDTISGGSGDDVVRTGADADTVDGGSGSDLLDYSQSDEAILVDLQANTAFGGYAEGDVISSFENLIGSIFADTITGTSKANAIDGLDGGDLIDASGGNDTVDGGDGNDTLRGGNGFDTLLGGVGNDLLQGGDHADRLVGDIGNDTLEGEGGADRLFGDAGFDTLNGGDGNDMLQGGAQADVLSGENGNDTVKGDNGADQLFGNSGFDTLIGGDGNDTMTGGLNADRFVFADGFGNDVITDFAATNNAEKIDLSGVTSITNFADLTNAGNPHMTQVGSDVVIDDFAGNTITLLNVSLGDLNGVDFVF